MTSAKGETCAGQYPCDGWSDHLKPTLLLFTTIIYFPKSGRPGTHTIIVINGYDLFSDPGTQYEENQ